MGKASEEHRLPVEIMHKILVLSFTSSPRPLSLLRVCHTVQDWLLPLLYHSINFTASSQLTTFLSCHDIPNDPMEERFRLIQNMHIGRTPSTSGDLTHTSTNWPLTVIGRILWLTTSLESLTLLELDQNVWYRFEHAISASLRYLALEPIHGPFHPQDLKKRPKLETFVSVLTYMRDDEVRDVVCFPSLKRFSRMLDAPSSAYLTDPGLSFVVDQAKCVSQSTNLERLEFVLSGCLPFTRQAKEATDDPRVLVMGDARNWLNVIYDEYLLERQKFIDLQLSL